MVVALVAPLIVLAVYLLMAFLPAIPKLLFVPMSLLYLAVQLLGLPIFLLWYSHLPQITWMLSLGQVLLGLFLLYGSQGGLKCKWPILPMARLGDWRFSWGNLIGFALANACGLLPAVLFYIFLCAGGLVDHFTDGFMTLHPGGFTVQVRKYVRADGKTIQLFPMSHVAEAEFYRAISKTFPTNSLILMEGVTDENQLLKHKINYKRMANALGLAEQHEQFEPTRGEIVPADIDVNQFTTNTLDLLNLVILFHTGGMDAKSIQKLVQFSSAPDFLNQLLNDLLQKRNEHLLGEIKNHLPDTEHIIVPWGVAHMPGIAAAIQKQGFHLEETKEYPVINFHVFGNRENAANLSNERSK